MSDARVPNQGTLNRKLGYKAIHKDLLFAAVMYFRGTSLIDVNKLFSSNAQSWDGQKEE